MLIPLGRQVTFEQCRTLGALLARAVAAELPEIATIVRQVHKRDGKVYLDSGQNGHGQLLVAPFSVRPVPGAQVSMPLKWSEVTPKLSLADYTIRTAPARIKKWKADPLLPVLDTAPDLPAALENLATMFARRKANRAGETGRTVNGLLELPDKATALYVLAHGAGAGMRHPFMAAIAKDLAAAGIGTFRYEFAYMEAKRNRPDTPAVAVVRVREAVAEAARLAPGLPLIAGGKSFGGRMTSTAQAEQPLPGVRGLAFLGFPLHPPGKPGIERAAHLDLVGVPMLFLQGSRDEFARPELLREVLQRLGARATLCEIPLASHSFAVPKSYPGDVMAEIADATGTWMQAVLGGRR